MKTQRVKGIKYLYDTDYYTRTAEDLIRGLTEEEVAMWITNDATRALLLLIEGSVVDTMFCWKSGLISDEHVKEAQGICQGLEMSLDMIDLIKKREIDES